MSVADRPQKKSGGLGETVSVIVQALLLALVIRTLLFQPFSIPSGSMRPTLLEGDYLFVTKWAYGYSRYSLPLSPDLFSGRVWASDPERGDVVVFKFPPNPSLDYIKRVIGLPGDVVECCDEQNRILVNGVPMEEDEYLYPGSVASHTEFGPIEVPEDHLWVMGDHRAISYDSRLNQNNPGGGAIPIDHVVGRAFVIIWPIDQAGGLGVPDTFDQLSGAGE